MQSLLETARKATLPAIWSQGVKLARAGAVTQATSAAGEVTLRVRAAGLAIAPTVTLYIEDLEWSCDCGGKVDPCAHVAAAVITAAAAPPGAPAPSAHQPTARLVHRLSTKGRLLTLRRVLVGADGREQPVEDLASQVARGRVEGFEPTHDDLRLDRIVGYPVRDVVPLARMGDVLDAMSGGEVTLDGERVKASGERVLPHAILGDAPNGGYLLRIVADSTITRVVAMGIALCGDTLRPLGETSTSGEMLEQLPLVRRFDAGREGELVGEVLPELRKRLSVEVATARLPRRETVGRPRIAFEVTHEAHALSVLPTLVYGDPPVLRIDGDDVVVLGDELPKRRPDDERTLVWRLRDELNLVPGRRIHFDGADALKFAMRLRAWDAAVGGRTESILGGQRSLQPTVRIDGSALDVVFECVAEGGGGGGARLEVDGGAVLRAWRDGLPWVAMSDGGWAPLPLEWLARHGHRVADLLAARDADKRVARAALPQLAELCEALDMPKPPDLSKLAALIRGFEEVPSAPLPTGLHATLRPYQERGFHWLSFLRKAELGAVLADDMGLGKTLQAISVLEGRTLVVAPKSVVYNWVDEIRRFRPELRACTYEGPDRRLDPTADVTLTSYAVLRLDAERLAQERFDVVVLDEAQAIKNEFSQTARAAFGLRAAFRVALSGTPVENRMEELWSIMHFANPGLLGGRTDFQDRTVGPITSGDPSAVERLRAKIRPFLLRRLKRDVLPELPPRTEAVLHVELDEGERLVYDTVRAAARTEVAAQLSEGGVMAALEALLRLRQAASHCGLVPGQTAESSSKVRRLIEALTEAVADGHKALVFSQWTAMLDRVEPHLAQADIGFCRLDGSTRDRASVVARFQAADGPPVMLVSLKAGGTGLNLTAADHVFLLDPWWNPAVEDQAADRAHRIGQDRPVTIYRLVAKDTVEERILALKEAKRGLAQAALGGAEGAAGALTRADLLALLD